MIIEGQHSIHMAGPARLVPDDRELAWAERSIKQNPALAWLLGSYVEADKANSNKQFWKLEELKAAQSTIPHGPLNLLHRSRAVVGHIVDCELVYPVTADEAANGFTNNPFIEALACMYRYYFPEELKAIRKAHDMGQLWFSMESLADSVTCAGEGGCDQTFPYAGPVSETYCAHLNHGESTKQLNKPHFLAAGLIFPPEKPGWKGAEVKDLSALVTSYEREAAATYEQIRREAPHLSPAEWEASMLALLQSVSDAEAAREFDTKSRQRMAKQGSAMGDGSFPIANAQDLRNAIRAIGRANPSKRAAAKAHIKKRAKALGLESLIPADWK